MPTYEFRCPKGHKFTHFYKTISAAQSQLPCPECGAEAERQLSGGAGFAFKGSGFYLTDYGRNAHRGDSKPAAKAESVGGESKAESSKATANSQKPAAESSKPAAESPKPRAESSKSESAKKAERPKSK